jgi:hypothetical protein
MKPKAITTVLVTLALCAAGSITTRAQPSELDELKAKMKAMEQTMEEMKQKIADLEKQKALPAAPVAATPSTGGVEVVTFKPATEQIVGHASPIESRHTLNDQQEGAQRPNDLTLDPKYRGFIPVPNTPVLIKFNAKPRVDMMSDSQNSGNADRFVTAQIPLNGTPQHGGGEQFNMTAKGSQMSLDVRAPDMEGNFRFYYQNDFFGSGSGMAYRLKQLYGQFYNVTAGFTYSIFEDPDIWPDTVDYEGPNSAIFARQPTVRYMWPLNDHWQMNFGLQQPATDVNGGPEDSSPYYAATANNQAPDGGFNIRWEDSKAGHVQFATILRDLGARDPGGVGDQNVLGWGLNLSAGLNVLKRDSIQGQLTYGEGVFHFCNDNFQNNDVAYDSAGNLKALPYFGAMAGYTHHWSDAFRSTASFGYANLDNQASEGPDAYHRTYYTSLNLVWQLRKHLSIGLEGLYGKREVQSGDTGDVFRVQLGLVYSFFD